MNEINKLIEQLQDEKVIEIMADLGATDYIDKDGYIQFKTICHHENEEDGNHKLYYYKNTHRFVCYSCCGSLSIVELMKQRYELLNYPYNFYTDIVLKLGGGRSKNSINNAFLNKYESLYNKKEKPIVKLEPINKGLLNVYTHMPIQTWEDEGISNEIIDKYNILFSVGENKIIIPHYDINGNLIGIRGRAFDEEDLLVGKYMPVIIEGKMYSHPLGFNLYGLNLVKDNIKKYKMAIISESEKGTLQYGTMFGQDVNICVATCGSSFHRYQLELLLSCGAERILIAYDKEGESWKDKGKYYDKLKRICEKYKNYCQCGFIFDSNNLLNLKDSPFDRGKEVFAQLYKKGVWI